MGTKRSARLTLAEKLERAALLSLVMEESAVAGVQLTDHESILLHDRIASLVCSWRWEQDLVRLVNEGAVPLCTRRHDQVRAFFTAEIYPPGGADSAMQICTTCHCPMPPCVVGSVGVCYECYQLNLEDARSAQQPIASQFVWVVRDKEALRLLDQGFQRYRSRSGSRPLYLQDDPRVGGGRIDADGVLHDPWMGESAPPPAAIAEAAEQRAAVA
jgi:hypothetical protein